MKITVKRLLTTITLLLIVLLFTGCSGANYTMTGSHNKTKIEVTADDGAYGEGFVMDINKNQIISIESELQEGELQIDLNEVINTADADESSEYEIIGLIKTVNVKPGDKIEFPLDYVGDFMPCLTAIGKTTGTVYINVVKP